MKKEPRTSTRYARFGVTPRIEFNEKNLNSNLNDSSVSAR